MAQHTPLKPERAVWAMLLMLLTAQNDKKAVRLLRLLRRTARTLPGLQPYFDLFPTSTPGRPKGRRSLDPGECYLLAVVRHYAIISKADILRILGKPANTATYHWLERRLEFGRSLLRQKPNIPLLKYLAPHSVAQRRQLAGTFLQQMKGRQ